MVVAVFLQRVVVFMVIRSLKVFLSQALWVNLFQHKAIGPSLRVTLHPPWAPDHPEARPGDCGGQDPPSEAVRDHLGGRPSWATPPRGFPGAPSGDFGSYFPKLSQLPWGDPYGTKPQAWPHPVLPYRRTTFPAPLKISSHVCFLLSFKEDRAERHRGPARSLALC